MGAMINSILGLMIALLPLYTKVAAVDVSWISKEVLLVLFMILVCFMLPNKDRAISKGALVGLVYGLFLLVFNQHNPASFIVQYQTFCIGAGLVFFASFYERHSKDKLDHILNGMSLGCIIQSVLVIGEAAGVNLYHHFLGLFISDFERVGKPIVGLGSFGNPNLLAAYVSITTLSLFRGSLSYLLLFPIAALIVAKSAMGYATLICGSLYFINQNYKLVKNYVFYIASTIGMSLLYVLGLNGADSGRFKIWAHNFSLVDLTHFVFGKGAGWFYDLGFIYVTDKGQDIVRHEHNEIIALFNLFGIIGVLCLFYFLFKVSAKKSHPIFQSILFAGFINSLGHFNMHQATTALILISTAAICAASES